MASIDSAVEIVCDAGPLIHLDELDCLSLLSDFQSAFVPDQVWHEVEKHRPRALEPQHELQRRAVEPRSDFAFQTLVQAFSLDLGERAALSLMTEHSEAVLLTDDYAARLAAKALGYRSHGTIAILLRAIRRGQKSKAEVLGILRRIPVNSTLHIRPRLLAAIIEQVELT